MTSEQCIQRSRNDLSQDNEARIDGGIRSMSLLVVTNEILGTAVRQGP